MSIIMYVLSIFYLFIYLFILFIYLFLLLFWYSDVELVMMSHCVLELK